MQRNRRKQRARITAGAAALALVSSTSFATVMEFDEAGRMTTKPAINYLQRARLTTASDVQTMPAQIQDYIEHMVNDKSRSVDAIAESAEEETPPMVVATLPDISKLPAAAITYVDVTPRPKSEHPLQTKAAEIAATHAIPPHLFLALVKAESGFNPNAVSPKGAIGLTQLMPATAKSLGVDPYDPEQNLIGGARYLHQQYERFGTWPLALAAYNAGPTRVAKLGRIPNIVETKAFVARVMKPAVSLRTPSTQPRTERTNFHAQTSHP